MIPSTAPGPVRRVLVTWTVLTPLVVLVQWLTGPLLTGLAPPLTTAVGCAVVVPLTGLVVLPAAMRAAAGVLDPPRP